MSDDLVERVAQAFCCEGKACNAPSAEACNAHIFREGARDAIAVCFAKRDELRAKLTMAREAISDARDFTATTLAKIGDGHRIGELVQDWDYALACIDAALNGGGDE